MFDPIQLPNELPINSLKILLDFARQKQPWGRDVLAAAATVALYGAQIAVPAPSMETGEAFDPEAALEAAISQAEAPDEAKQFLPIPWVLLAQWAIGLLINRLNK
jgi:hypothetical protein